MIDYSYIHEKLLNARPNQISECEWIAAVMIGLTANHNERGVPMRDFLRSQGYKDPLLEFVWGVAEIINDYDRLHGVVTLCNISL